MWEFKKVKWSSVEKPIIMYPGLHLGPGQSLVSGFVLWLSSSSVLGLLLPQQRVVGQDSGVGLQHVVENVEAVCAADLWALVHRTHLWEVEVLVGAHQRQQLLLQWADLLRHPLKVGDLVQIPPVALQNPVEHWQVCVSVGADGSKLLQGIGTK